MNLILLQPSSLSSDETLTIDGRQAEHIRKHLKKEVGHTFRVGIVNGPEGTATIHSIQGGRIFASCTWTLDHPRHPPMDLLLALPRPKVMKRLWAQLAALGVGHIYLTNAWKVEPFYFDSHVLDSETYEPLLVEGLQQAHDTFMPTVSIHRRFGILMEEGLPDIRRWVAHPGDGRPDGTPLPIEPRSRHLLAIGPEGGWTDQEVETLQNHAFDPFSLGPRILRSDTACIAAMALLHGQLRRAST